MGWKRQRIEELENQLAKVEEFLETIGSDNLHAHDLLEEVRETLTPEEYRETDESKLDRWTNGIPLKA